MTAPTTTETTDWRTLDAGIALDVLVATRVLGLAYERVTTGGVTYHEVRAPGQTHADFLPAYSSNICDAWQVVEAMEARAAVLAYRTRGVRARRVEVHVPPAPGGIDALYAWESSSAALAICKAALAAVEAS